MAGRALDAAAGTRDGRVCPDRRARPALMSGVIADTVIRSGAFGVDLVGCTIVVAQPEHVASVRAIEIAGRGRPTGVFRFIASSLPGSRD
jgi:hypothetical protein